MRVLANLFEFEMDCPPCRKGLFETILLCTVCVFFAFFNLVAHGWYGHLLFWVQGVWQFAFDVFSLSPCPFISISISFERLVYYAYRVRCYPSCHDFPSLHSGFQVALVLSAQKGGKGEMMPHAKSISSICWLDLSGAKLFFSTSFFLFTLCRSWPAFRQNRHESDWGHGLVPSTCAHFRSRALFLHLFSCCYLFFLFLGRFRHHPLGFDLQWIDRKVRGFFYFFFVRFIGMTES